MELISLAVAAAIDAFRLFAIGASRGGTRSLAAPMSIGRFRSATRWSGADVILRLSIGLEDEAELWSDIERFFKSLEALQDAGHHLGAVSHG